MRGANTGSNAVEGLTVVRQRELIKTGTLAHAAIVRR